MIQRFRDWLLELHIRRLAWLYAEADSCGHLDQAELFWQGILRAVSRRSDGQIERMERRTGMR